MDRFNSSTYKLIDLVTGEEVPLQAFVERVTKDKWEKAYAKTLAEYIGMGGNEACKVLAYLIAERTSKNLILGTHKEVAEDAGVSARFVSKLYAVLMNRGMLKKVRNGCYFLNPEIICYGKKTHGAMLLRLWGEL